MDRLSVVGNESTWLGCNLQPRWGHELLRCTVRSHTKPEVVNIMNAACGVTVDYTRLCCSSAVLMLKIYEAR